MKWRRFSWCALASAVIAAIAVLVIAPGSDTSSPMLDALATNEGATGEPAQLEGDDSATQREPSSVLETATRESSAYAASHARIVVLSKTTRSAPTDTAWIVSRLDDPDALSRRSPDSAGGIDLLPGTWRIEPTNSRWFVENGVVRASSGDTKILWVGERSTFEVTVVDELRAPIANASVRWLPAIDDPLYDPDWDWWRRTFPQPERTDANGRARLVDAIGPQGNLAVVEDGYVGYLANVRITDIAHVDVVLRRAHDDIRLSVTDATTREPIAGATLLTRYGPSAGESSSDGVLIVPSWAATDTIVRVSAAGYCTADCSIGTTDSRDVVLTKSCELDVTADAIAATATYQASIERLDVAPPGARECELSAASRGRGSDSGPHHRSQRQHDPVSRCLDRRSFMRRAHRRRGLAAASRPRVRQRGDVEPSNDGRTCFTRDRALRRSS